ncbi:MAG: UDP-N-acetylmuramoyl-L-alanine--D-glutamate ligase [Pseudomonadota bacterium]
MIAARAFKGKKTAVFGLARTGISAARALLQGGAEVVAWDDAQAKRKDASAVLGTGVQLADLAMIDWTKIAALVLSPGVPLHFPAPHPVVRAARDAGCEVIGDVELFFRARRTNFPETKLVLVTGTNGKSTTTALIGHLVREAGLAVQVGGNIGTAALDLEQLGLGGVYVLEMSSYQLDLTGPTGADVAVWLNITPDHIDRHGSLAGYVAAKQRIFNGLAQEGVAVVGVDDPHSEKICDALRASGVRVNPVAVEHTPIKAGVYVQDGILYDALSGAAQQVTDLRRLTRLPGAHNWQNAAAAYAAALALGIARDHIVRGLESFAGLAHRMEEVGRVKGVRFINDSKATNADATARALACYDSVYVILGGVPKEGGIDSLAQFFPRIRKAYLIGQAADAFAETLEGRAPYQKCGDLANAVSAAAKDAAKADAAKEDEAVVLLSPACASFDQFENFEARGEMFRKLVSEHAAKSMSGSAV